MAEQKFFTPLKVGLLIVIISYFLFTLHAMFTLSWLGEWEAFREPIRTIIFVEDISATACLAFRFAASILAFAAIVAYLVKKNLSKPTVFKVARLVLVFEGIYWLGLVTTAGYSVQAFWSSLVHHQPFVNLLYSLLTSVIPPVMEAIILPIILFIFAFKLKPNKPIKTPIKWGFIASTVYIVVFWLTNTSSWLGLAQLKGTEYLTARPEHLISFVLTVFGLLALSIYAGYITKKSAGTETLQELKPGAIGAITTALGLYFLWNYLSWVIFAGNTWNFWYAWFLGHNMDLWMLALPLVGLPLLFYKQPKQTSNVK